MNKAKGEHGGYRRNSSTAWLEVEEKRVRVRVTSHSGGFHRCLNKEREGLRTEATTATPMLESRIKGTEACGCTEANNGGGLGDGLV